MKTDRVQTFSDGIFAILITILVLELDLPRYSQGSLKEAVLGQWPIVFAYVITFSYIGFLWLFHHDLFRIVEKTSVKLNVMNLISIFLTTLLSYSMSLLSESMATSNKADMRFSIALYSLLACGISLSYFVIYWYLAKNSDLLLKWDLRRYMKYIQRFPLISSLIYFLAFTLAWISVPFGLAFLIAGLVFHYYAYWQISRKYPKV